MSIAFYKKKALFIFVLKCISLSVLILTTLDCQSQEIIKKTGLIRGTNYNEQKSNKKKFGSFAGGASNGIGSTRWGFGIKGGLNFTNVKPNDQFSVFSYTTTPENGRLEKQYLKPFENGGFHLTFIAKYALIGSIQISLQPTFASYKFGYQNDYAWLDFENTNNSLDLSFKHTQSLNYVEIPLLVRYDVLNMPVKPFVHGGAFYGRLLNALKKVEVSGEDKASGGADQFNGNTSSIGVDDLFIKSHLGLLVGGGVGLPIGPATIELGVDYKIGLNNIVSETNRFSDNTLVSGNYDILDNLKMKNLAFSMGFIFGF